MILKKLIITQPFGNNHFNKIYTFKGINNEDISLDFRGWLNVYKKYGLVGHNGIDFRVKIGEPVYAICNGTVEHKNDPSGYGKYIKLTSTAKGTVYIYGHLSGYGTNNGATVNKGDIIGYGGNTGFSTAPHLHFEVRPPSAVKNNGYFGAVDPLPFIQYSIDETVYDVDTSLLSDAWHKVDAFKTSYGTKINRVQFDQLENIQILLGDVASSIRNL